MALDYSLTSAILKTLFAPGEIPDLFYKISPVFATMKKDPTFGGQGEKVAMRVNPVQSTSATFSAAQTAATNYSTNYQAFTVTPVKKYAIARITGEMVMASQTDRTSFTRSLSAEIKSAQQSFIQSLEKQILRDGAGVLGVVGTSGLSTIYLTLAHYTQANNFNVGQLVVSAADTASSLQSGSAPITAIDRDTGILTTTGASNWTSQIATIADGYSIMIAGDYVTAADRLCVSGLTAWNPYSTSGLGTAFFGVTRSADTNRLAGSRLDASGMTIEDGLISSQQKVVDLGQVPNLAIMSGWQFRRLVQQLGTKVIYNEMQARNSAGPMANIGFRTVLIQGAMGPIEVLASPYQDYAYTSLINSDNYMLNSMGPLPQILTQGAGAEMIIPVYNEDTYEVRIGSYLNCKCENPAANCQTLLDVTGA